MMVFYFVVVAFVFYCIGRVHESERCLKRKVMERVLSEVHRKFMTNNLQIRDDFLVSRCLWSDFLDYLKNEDKKHVDIREVEDAY